MTVQDLARELLNLSLTCGRPVSSLLAQIESEITLNGNYFLGTEIILKERTTTK